LLFGKVKIWGEIVEHEAGYRSQFGKIVSLDYGDPELLMKFRTIYRLNMSSSESSAVLAETRSDSWCLVERSGFAVRHR